MSVDQATLADFDGEGDDEPPVEIDLPPLPPAEDVDDDSPVRWRDYGVEPYEPSEDAGINEHGALAILERDELETWDAQEILTREERTRGEQVAEHPHANHFSR